MNDAVLKFQIGDMIMVVKEHCRYWGIVGEGEISVLLREADTTSFDDPHESRSLCLATHVKHLRCQKGDVVSLVEGSDKALFFLDLWTFIDSDKRDAIKSALSEALSVDGDKSCTTIIIKYNE